MTLKFKKGQHILCLNAEDANEGTKNNFGIILEVVETANLPYLVGFKKSFFGAHSEGGSEYIGKSWWCSGRSFKLVLEKTKEEQIINKINYLYNKQKYVRKLK